MNSRLVAFYMQFWCSFSAKMSRLKILKNGSLFVNLSSSCARETIHFTFLFLLFSSFCFPVVRSQDVEDSSRVNCGYDIKKEGERVALVYSLGREVTIFESYLECIALHVSELW